MKTWLEYARLHLDKSDDHPLECEVKDAKEVLAEIDRLTRKRDTARMALEIIAGKRQCVDNLMSNVEIALCALEQQERSLDYQPITGKGVDALDRRTPEAMAQVQDYIRERVSTGEPVGLKPLIRRGEGESDGDTDLSAGSPVPTLEQTADNT